MRKKERDEERKKDERIQKWGGGKRRRKGERESIGIRKKIRTKGTEERREECCFRD